MKILITEVIEDTNVQYRIIRSDFRHLDQKIYGAFAKFRSPELDVNAILANDYRKLV